MGQNINKKRIAVADGSLVAGKITSNPIPIHWLVSATLFIAQVQNGPLSRLRFRVTLSADTTDNPGEIAIFGTPTVITALVAISPSVQAATINAIVYDLPAATDVFTFPLTGIEDNSNLRVEFEEIGDVINACSFTAWLGGRQVGS